MSFGTGLSLCAGQSRVVAAARAPARRADSGPAQAMTPAEPCAPAAHMIGSDMRASHTVRERRTDEPSCCSEDVRWSPARSSGRVHGRGPGAVALERVRMRERECGDRRSCAENKLEAEASLSSS
eukprot:342028-Rhodomonas_salina.1